MTQINAIQVANWFITRSKSDGVNLSVMSLMNISFIAHGWHLETQGSPLFSDKIEAWHYGQVIPNVYNEFRSQGLSVTTTSQSHQVKDMPSATTELLELVWTVYGKLPSSRLSELTHIPGGPWDIARKVGGDCPQIPDILIAHYHQYLRKSATQSKQNTKEAQHDPS